MIQNEKHKELGYDVVLPSHLLVNPDIEPNAKLLYGLIRNLTKLEGYCFARNSYLADLMNVDARTIRRWLDSLQKHGYVERHKEETAFNSIRKIYISDNFKKVLQKDKNVPEGGQKLPPPRTKMPSSKEEIRKEDIYKKEQPPYPPKESIEKKKKDAPEAKKSRREYGLHRKYNEDWLNKVMSKCSEHFMSGKILITKSNLLFRDLDNARVSYWDEPSAFREQVLNFFRKMDLPTSGL